MQTTRAQHLAWCKRRAMEYVAGGSYDDAVASMISDLSKHSETRYLATTAVLLSRMVRDRESATKFVQGFN